MFFKNLIIEYSPILFDITSSALGMAWYIVQMKSLKSKSVLNIESFSRYTVSDYILDILVAYIEKLRHGHLVNKNTVTALKL